MTQEGARAASQRRMRFSVAAVREWLRRWAGRKVGRVRGWVVIVRLLSGGGCRQGLVGEGVAGGAEGEFQGFAGDGGDEGLDGPGEAVGNGAGEGEGFDLDEEAGVGFCPGPVGVETPEVAVFAAGGEDVFGGGAGVLDLRDAGAAADAEAVAGVEAGELEFVAGVEDDGEDVGLADAHGGGDAVAGGAVGVGGEDLCG